MVGYSDLLIIPIELVGKQEKSTKSATVDSVCVLGLFSRVGNIVEQHSISCDTLLLRLKLDWPTFIISIFKACSSVHLTKVSGCDLSLPIERYVYDRRLVWLGGEVRLLMLEEVEQVLGVFYLDEDRATR